MRPRLTGAVVFLRHDEAERLADAAPAIAGRIGDGLLPTRPAAVTASGNRWTIEVGERGAAGDHRRAAAHGDVLRAARLVERFAGVPTLDPGRSARDRAVAAHGSSAQSAPHLSVMRSHENQ